MSISHEKTKIQAKIGAIFLQFWWKTG